MPSRATVATRPNSRWLALLAATAIVLYLCWLMLQPFVDVLLWATVLAIVVQPVYRRFRHGGRSESVAAILTTALAVLVVLIPLTLVTTAVFRQGADAAESFHAGFKRLLDPDSALFKRLDKYVDLDPLRDPKVLAARLSAVSGAIANRTLGIIGGLLGGAVQVFFVLFTLYYLLRDSERVVPSIRRSLPLTDEQSTLIFRRTGEVIHASVNGVLVIAAVQGALGMVAFYALGLPSALLWGVVMFLLSTIPMAGAFVVWVPAAIYLAATGHWVKAGLLTAWGAVVIGTVDNVLRPRLVGKQARLHELIIFFSVLGGLQVFGVLGLFVGPVVAAIALALVDVFHHMNATTEAAAVVVTPDSTLPPPPQTPEPAAAPPPDRTAASDR
jgi:predicted PurR-regulated permease PerM